MNKTRNSPPPKAPLQEGAMIGILGGGQLGRMTALAASTLGYRCHVFAPEGDAPATDVADSSTRADYDDKAALADFAKSVDAVISEFENVPAEVMDHLAQYVPVSPGAEALRCAQHRITEKSLAQELGIATPAFAPVSTVDDITAALESMPNGAILKTCRGGYDGKGQVGINTATDAKTAFQTLGSATNNAPTNNTAIDSNYILEEKIAFRAEVSFLIARGSTGDIAHFPPTINTHKNGILHLSHAPADTALLSDTMREKGEKSALALAEHLNLTGLLAVEMFITKDDLLFNEMAPRPHNSFHWTIEGAQTSQFAQLVRAITGLPLGSTKAKGRWQMENILGEDMPKLEKALAEEGVFVHRYGKNATREGRKMGHITKRLED